MRRKLKVLFREAEHQAWGRDFEAQPAPIRTCCCGRCNQILPAVPDQEGGKDEADQAETPE